MSCPESDKKRKINIGLDTCWPQFPGLYERLQGYQKTIAKRLAARHPRIHIVDTGIVDNPIRARETRERVVRSGERETRSGDVAFGCSDR